MHKFNIKKQVGKLYGITAIGYFQIAGASWVALLAARGFSLIEIGIIESIFHAVSICFEVPSGVAADVFGRKKTLVISQIVSLISNILMIFSGGFWSTALAMGFSALSYNLSSGTREALAYDSLKYAGQEEIYNRFASAEMALYRISSSTATLCAGLALFLGYKTAYAIDVLFSIGALSIALCLKEVEADCQNTEKRQESILEKLKNIVLESGKFLLNNGKARTIMIVNSLIGAVSTLVLFFLQAKLPMAGLNSLALGPALFIMGLGAVVGARMVAYFPQYSYKKLLTLSAFGVGCALAAALTGNVLIMIAGGFLGALADDFLEVKTDVILNEMIPSEQRATLISVGSFMFSIVMIFLSTFMGWRLS